MMSPPGLLLLLMLPTGAVAGSCHVQYTVSIDTKYSVPDYLALVPYDSKDKEDCMNDCNLNGQCHAFEYDIRYHTCTIHLDNRYLKPEYKETIVGVHHYRLITHKCIGLPYIGCFHDKDEPDLDGLRNVSKFMTNERCIGLCRSKGKKYAGTQNGNQCRCGNSYGRYGASSNCSVPCRGDSAQICGGAWAGGELANSVYRANSIFRGVVDPVNLALNKPAIQQGGAVHGGDASRAVDGNADPEWSTSSCTHTAEDSHQPWWAVDLGEIMNIAFVQITNRQDCCSHRLADFQIGIDLFDPRIVAPVIGGYDVCATQESALSDGETKDFSCMGYGSYIIVQLKGDNPLTLCEVEVYGGMNSEQDVCYTY